MLSSLSRSNTTHDFGSIFYGLLGVKGRLFPSEALKDHSCV